MPEAAGGAPSPKPHLPEEELNDAPALDRATVVAGADAAALDDPADTALATP
jgi:hypothetical protein